MSVLEKKVKKFAPPASPGGVYAVVGSVGLVSFLYWCSRHMATKPIIARGRTTINAVKMIICMVYSLSSSVFCSFVVNKSPSANVTTASIKPPIIIIACGSSPRKIPAINIPPNTSFPMSTT